MMSFSATLRPRSYSAIAWFVCCVVLAGATPVVADESFAEQTDVFVSGHDGYHTYRIPAMVVTKQGTILALCEGRKTSRSDHGDVDLIVRRSTDGGRIWSPTQLVYEEGGAAKITIGNPCPVVDRQDGVIWLPFCRDNRDVFYSDDHGRSWRLGGIAELSWTKPKHHPEVYCPVCQAGLLHCPGNLKRSGELIVYSGPGGPGRTHMTVRFSRDGGETWPIAKTLHQGPAAYSDLVLLPGGEIGCLYERGDRGPYERLTFARFATDE